MHQITSHQCLDITFITSFLAIFWWSEVCHHLFGSFHSPFFLSFFLYTIILLNLSEEFYIILMILFCVPTLECKFQLQHSELWEQFYFCDIPALSTIWIPWSLEASLKFWDLVISLTDRKEVTFIESLWYRRRHVSKFI